MIRTSCERWSLTPTNLKKSKHKYYKLPVHILPSVILITFQPTLLKEHYVMDITGCSNICFYKLKEQIATLQVRDIPGM
ncbi:hypothetical protein L3X38_039164 [Prunus dulcis]|uniref:Uncharacterized protein n=1 Tax=Prunus dulcis TaxID=3755 RepID=A0AAD4V8S3_PRUDU|nr:hypothetical protein L3X38_039164 [Prunus dulcis]